VTAARWWRRPAAFDALVAAVTTGIELALVIDGWPDWTWTALVLSALTGATLVLRRQAPLAVLAATVAMTAVVEWHTGGHGLAGGAPVIVALFTVAELRDRWVAVGTLIPTATLLQLWAISSPPVGIVAVVLGALLQTRRRYTAALEERAAYLEREREQLDRIAAQEGRAAIARELHDIVAHSVTVMLLGVRGARDVLRTSPDVADDALRRVERTAEQSMGELRRILALLRDPDRDAPAGVRPAPTLEELGALVDEYRDAGLPARLEVDGERRRLPDGVELSVYRIVEEALTNVLRHTRASDVVVRLRYGADTLEVRVDDDGEPRHPAGATTAGQAGGHGILGMRERAAALGGEVEADVRPGGGFRVDARLPIGTAS
jgi:signal transduction histidine kinase